MTRRVPRRHAVDPADSDLFERQEAALSIWTGSSGGNNGSSQRGSTFSKVLVWLWAGFGDAVVLHLLPHLHRSIRRGEWESLAKLQLLPLSPFRSLVTHRQPLHSPASPPPTSEAVSAKEKRGSRHRHSSHSERQCPVVSETDFFLSSHHNSETVHRPPKQKTVYCDYILDFPINTYHPASEETVPQTQAIITNIHTTKSDNFSHSITISSPFVQPFPASRAAQILPSPSPVSPSQVKAAKAQPVPVPAPRAARAQHVPAPVPVPPDGAVYAQPSPIPVPAPRARAAVTLSTRFCSSGGGDWRPVSSHTCPSTQGEGSQDPT
ncbi:unnamed protein product [Oreochromis niloticus]|nr:unnamed protein product [Mustela putorius furo]